jgi:hypothetical protein
MEEGETEEQLFVGLWFGALFEVLEVKSLVGSQDVLSETARGLKGHLH